MKKTPLKRGTCQLKRGKPLKKSTKTKESVEQDKEQRDKDMRFYMSIWNKRPRVDFETGEQLWGESTAHFHHVLEKENYPEYRYEEWNIVLVSLLTHDQYHKSPRMCPKIEAYREKLLKQLDL